MTINQNIDHTGVYNLTGVLNVSSNAFVTGSITVRGGLTVQSTGYFDGVRVTGSIYSEGNNALTGVNNLHGTTYVSGTTRVSGDLTIVAATGNVTKFDGYFRPYIVAQGFGINNVTSLVIGSFWTATKANATAPGTGIWLTPYSGRLGEMGLFMTGASNSVLNNNNLPLGTYGKVFQLVNVGVNGGSGVWYPIGL